MTSDIRGKQGQRGKGWEESFGLGVHQSRVGDVRGPWAAFCVFTEIQRFTFGWEKRHEFSGANGKNKDDK